MLTESQIDRICSQILTEEFVNGLDENFFDDTKAAFKSFLGRGTGAGKYENPRQGTDISLDRLKKRWNAAKTGYKTSKRVGELDKVIDELQSLLDQGKITPDTTVGQLVGTNNRFGKLTAMKQYQRSRDSKAQNDIYREG